MWRTETCVSLGFNHQGNRLASTGWDGYTRLWEFGSGRELIGYYGIAGNIIGFSSDDLRLATLHWVGEAVDFFEVTPEPPLSALYEALEASGSAGVPVVDRSGKMLAFRTHEGIRLVNLETGRQVDSAKLAKEKYLVGFDEEAQSLILTGQEGLFRCRVKMPT